MRKASSHKLICFDPESASEKIATVLKPILLAVAAILHAISPLFAIKTLLNKNGIIFFDDTESLPYRLKKNFSLSIVNDEIDKVIKNFYYSNYDQYFYTKHYIGAGLSFLEKKSEKGVQLSKFKVWNYGLINSQIYILIKKILFYIRNLRK